MPTPVTSTGTPAGPSRPAWPGVVLVVLAVLVCTATAVVDLRLPADSVAPLLVPESASVFGITSVVMSVAAVAVLGRSPHRRFALLLGMLGGLWVLSTAVRGATRWSLRSVEVGATSLDAVQRGLLWATDLLTSPLAISAAVLLLVFPSGRLPSGRWGIAARGSLLVLVLGAVATVTTRIPIELSPEIARAEDDPVTVLDTTGVALWSGTLEPLLPGVVAACLTAFLVPLTTPVLRYRAADATERQRLRWVFWGAMVLLLAVVASIVVGVALDLGTLATLLAMNVPVVTMGIALVDPDLVPIEDLLSRTAVYGALSLTIVVIDLGVLAALTGVLDERLDDEQVVLVVLLLSAVLYNPLRYWLWALVRRLVLGERSDRYDAVAGLASSLEDTDESQEQLAAVARAVAQAFGVGYVRVEVEREPGGWSVAEVGTEPAHVRHLPISYRDQPVGRLVLPARGFRTRLGERDQRLLGDLVRQAATAARTGRLAAQLQDHRQRLVVAREETRRRIRHDLHEDLGPAIGGLVHQVETARLQLPSHPEAATATITAATEHLRGLVADVRRVVHDLRPPALDDRGLLGALQQQADLASTGTRTVTVEGSVPDRLPAAVEVAAFRVASQALAHVQGDPRARSCRVRLHQRAGDLRLELTTDASLDHALLGERASEIGGHVELDCDRLVVHLPLREVVV